MQPRSGTMRLQPQATSNMLRAGTSSRWTITVFTFSHPGCPSTCAAQDNSLTPTQPGPPWRIKTNAFTQRKTTFFFLPPRRGFDYIIDKWKKKKNLYLVLASENLSGKPQIYFSKSDFAGALCKQKFSISYYYNVMPILTLPHTPRYKRNICLGKGKTLF